MIRRMSSRCSSAEARAKPEELFADAGCGCGENIVACRECGVELTAPKTLGKAPDMNKIQLSDFKISDDGKEVFSCLQGHCPLSCTMPENKSKRKKKGKAIFPKEACSLCGFQSICLVKLIEDGNYRLEY
jgi:hypothetical protein